MNNLQAQAEKARQAGNRKLFLKLQAQIKTKEGNAVKTAHAARVAEFKKKYPLKTYIPELQSSVAEIKSDCGTQSGWISILMNSGKEYTQNEFYCKIQDVKNAKTADAIFAGLKFSDSKKPLLIGVDGEETLTHILNYMGLDRLPKPDCVFEGDYSGSYKYARDAAVENGYTDEQADEAGAEAESVAQDEDFKDYMRGIKAALESVLQSHALEMIDNGKGRWSIAAPEGWQAAADRIAETISGVGYSEYKNGTELRDVGPYKTYCEAVIRHLHHCKNHAEVYGTAGYSSVYERYIR